MPQVVRIPRAGAGRGPSADILSAAARAAGPDGSGLIKRRGG